MVQSKNEFTFIYLKWAVTEQRVGEGAAPLQGRQFRDEMYFYYTNRGAHIYIWSQVAIPPAPQLVMSFWMKFALISQRKAFIAFCYETLHMYFNNGTSHF